MAPNIPILDFKHEFKQWFFLNYWLLGIQASDKGASLIADFIKNKTVYLTVICVSIIYIILIIYARFKDKKDIEKLGVTPLPDNHQSDQYYYQIIVLTDQRKDAGTESKVHLVL